MVDGVLIVAGNWYNGDAVSNLKEERPELSALDSNASEAGLSFVEADGGGDDVDQHQRKKRALSYPDALISAAIIAFEAVDFVHFGDLCFNAGWARERVWNGLPPLKLVPDGLLLALRTCNIIRIFRHAVEYLLHAWWLLDLPLIQIVHCAVFDVRRVSIVILRILEARLVRASRHIFVFLQQIVLVQIRLEFLTWQETRILSDLCRHHWQTVALYFRVYQWYCVSAWICWHIFYHSVVSIVSVRL